MLYAKIFSFIFCLMIATLHAQTIQILTEGTNTSLRGLSVVNDKVIWASGNNGTVAKSIDGGKNWQWMIVKDYEKRDFRDIEAFDANKAIIMGIAEPAIILKTKDGGKNWYKVFEDSTSGMFLDAMDFSDEKHGMVIGDPINNKLYAAATGDAGDSWIRNDDKASRFIMDNGEAFFASSGTNIKILKNGMAFFVSGGRQSNIYNWDDTSIQPIPIMKETPSTGANSIDYFEAKQRGIIVGGDFTKDTININNCAPFTYTKEHFTFTTPKTPPHGYRSCVLYINENQLVTCGTSGVDISNDGGNNWQLISKEGFHVVQKAKKGGAVFLAGNKGRIALLKINETGHEK